MFGVTNSWILVGLAAVGLPVLIHFLTRARPRVIRYPTYHLLIEAGRGRQAVHRLRTWVILALRTLAVMALVLAFSRPFLKTPGADIEPGQARRVVLVVDASMSMRAVAGGISLFAKARAQAADLLRSLEEGSSAGVVFMGATPRAALPALSRNLAVLHEELASAEATLEKGDPMAALALAQTMLDGQGAVYVFSDFQRTNWGSVAFDSFAGMTFFLRPVTPVGIGNVGIVAIEKSPGEPIEGETIDVACTVFNATADKRLETVHLDLEGVTQNADIELQPYSSGTATFTFSLPTAGCFPGRLSLAPDDLNDDNTRYFKVPVRRALETLLVSDADRDDPASAAFFVETALCPSEYADTGITVTRRHSQEVDRASLERADAFFIVAPARLRGDTLETISRRVLDGAYLVCFLDGPTAPAVVGGLRGASSGMISPPFQLERAVAAERAGGEFFSGVRTAGGPLKVFDAPDQGDLMGLSFRRHYLTDVVPTRKEEVLARFPDGSAALSLSPAGRGAAIFVNFPVAPDGSDLVGNPLFPSLLHELMRALRTSGAGDADTPGTRWHIDVAAGQSPEGDEDACNVVGPDGQEIEAVVVARGRTVRLALPPASVPGHYRVSRGGAQVNVGIINVDAKETDTRQLNITGLLDAANVPRAGMVSVLDTEGQLISAGRPTRLWPHLAALAALCLGAEMLLLAVWRRRRGLVLGARLEGRAQ